MQGEGGDYGLFLDSVGIMACFADPTIILFLGGFILAIAATKSGLDVWMAKTMIKPFGKKSENVLLGFLLITGLFSMFISNTATAAMMLTFLTPVFKALPANGKGRIALTMAIPIGANLGGMGTPIGTPPNAFAFKVLNDPAGLNMDISFGLWMAVMGPLVLILLIIAWLLLRRFFPFTGKTIELDIQGDMQHNWRTVVVAVTMIVTILLWIFGKPLGINANTVAMLPIAVFALTGVITAKDLHGSRWFCSGYGYERYSVSRCRDQCYSFWRVESDSYSDYCGFGYILLIKLYQQHCYSSTHDSYPYCSLCRYG